jgi:hypothetical protein
MTPSGANGTRFTFNGVGCLAAVLLGIAVLWPNLAAAADVKGGSLTVSPVLRGDADDRSTEPEVAPGGTLVLRGTRAANPSPAPPNPGDRTQGTGAVTNGPAAPVGYSTGWDQRYDYSGLNWGPPGPVMGIVGR